MTQVAAALGAIGSGAPQPGSAGAAVAVDNRPSLAARPATPAGMPDVALDAVIVEAADGLAVVAHGGRLLGVEGLRQAAVGTRVRLSLPGGVPGIGARVAAQVLGGEPETATDARVTVRLVAPRRAAAPVQLVRAADDPPLAAMFVEIPEAGYPAWRSAARADGARSRSGSPGASSAGTAPATVEATVSEADIAGWLRLDTRLGSFLAPSRTDGLATGMRVALVLADPAAAIADGDEKGGSIGPAGEAKRLREGLGDGAAREGAMPPRPSSEEVAQDVAPAQHHDGFPLAERVAVGQARAPIVTIRFEDENTGPSRGPRRVIVALCLSRLGEVQLDMICGEREVDLTLRTERPLDPISRAEVESVVRATGGGRIGAAFATGLVPAVERARQ
jgi:hypothetical protein